MDIEESEEEMDTEENRKRPCEDSDEDAIAPAGSSSMITSRKYQSDQHMGGRPKTPASYSMHQSY